MARSSTRRCSAAIRRRPDLRHRRRGQEQARQHLEAFNFAKAEVARAYEKQGLLSTEHALLDDNGDKEGADVAGQGRQGQPRRKVAGILSFGAASAGLPSDPKLRALYQERLDLGVRWSASV